MLVLGIETSCDETGVAVYDSARGLRAHALFSQVDIHREYGGVVPELASRDHVRKWVPLLRQCLRDADLRLQDLQGIAYTAGPGLLGALLVGAAAGRSLAWALSIPALAVHHMEGHLLAPLLEPEPPEFPFVCLLVSGGHTMLVEVSGLGRYRMLGQSLDDAAGEAFDKSAKMLGLGYPGGPALARLAADADSGAFVFPRPMTDRPGLDFSFSGLKTHAILAWRDSDQSARTQAQVAHAFEEAVVETLVIKSERALRQCGAKRLVVAGGVGANRRLRARLAELGAEQGWRAYFPRIEFCTDNGAMIALAGAIRLQGGQSEPLAIAARARWPLTELTPPDAGVPLPVGG